MAVDAVDPAALAKFRGAPFDQANIDAAVASLRTECEWIIGPTQKQTFEIDVDHSGFTVPSLHLISIEALVDGDDPERDLLAESRRFRIYRRGRVKLLSGPALPEFIRVDVTHGHKDFPAELLPVIAARARDAKKGRTRTEAVAARSMTLDLAHEASLDAIVVDKYKLHHGPGGRS